jgi:CubicO group peptidase (beta-lactamase class C family)
MNVTSAFRFGSFVCAAAYGFVMLGGDGWPRGGDNDAGMVSTAQDIATSMTALLSGSLRLLQHSESARRQRRAGGRVGVQGDPDRVPYGWVISAAGEGDHIGQRKLALEIVKNVADRSYHEYWTDTCWGLAIRPASHCTGIWPFR